MRGKEFNTTTWGKPIWITPACAGKRLAPPLRTKCPLDHPRVCGEKFCACIFRVYKIGSPPRVRGKAFVAAVGVGEEGITPACAGKRYLCRSSSPRRKDHPRVCGEKRAYTVPQAIEAGSPPRVRGKARTRSRTSPRTRITPACAGKRSFLIVFQPPVHGSPPRVRGKEADLLSAP